MRYILFLLLPLLAACSSSGALIGGPTPPDVDKQRNGFYHSFVYTGGSAPRYYVDEEARLCFCSFRDWTFLIPCSNLKNRVEWRDIITWE